MSRSIAVVGSGPGGIYIVQGLTDKLPGCKVDVFDRLPTPFGLIRAGVAPDHQSVKNVSRAFDATMRAEGVRFLGNVEIGRDVSLAELEGMYDAVVLAYGAPHDRKLGIPGEDKSNVCGSNAFVGWYNGHPDFLDLDPDLDVETALVIGVGNVAVDVARLLSLTEAELAVTDISPYAAAAINASPVRDIHIVGRRGPVDATFTMIELRELGELANCVPVIDLGILPDTVEAPHLTPRELRTRERNIAVLRDLVAVRPDGKDKRLHLGFFSQPVEILGGERVEAVRFERTRVENGNCIPLGETFEIACGLVVACIGSRAMPIDGLPFDEARGIAVSDNGRIRDGLYSAGWLKRGAVGMIGTNKNDSFAVVDLMLADFSGPAKEGPAAFDRLAGERGLRVVSYAEWQIIDRLETAAAPAGAPRRKFLTCEEMLAALDEAHAAE